MIRPGEIVTFIGAGLAFAIGFLHQFASSILAWILAPGGIAPLLAQTSTSDGVAQLGIYGGLLTSIGGALTMLARLYYQDRHDDRHSKLDEAIAKAHTIQARLDEALAGIAANGERIKAMEAREEVLIRKNADLAAENKDLVRMLDEARHPERATSAHDGA